jgi:hypothetical protein
MGMGHRLPPDLDRLGDQLAAAAARAHAGRRRRMALAARLAATAAAAVVALTAFAPARLGPAADPSGVRALLATAVVPDPPSIRIACDQPRGGRLVIADCGPAPAITRGRAGRY